MGAPNPDITALVQQLALQHWTVANTPDLTGVIAAVNQQLGPLGGEINALLIAFATAQLDQLFAAQEATEDITVADVVGDVAALQVAVAALEAGTPTEVVSAKYGMTISQSMPNAGVATVVNFNAVVWDDTPARVTTGAAWHFTADEAGEYLVAAGVDSGGSAMTSPGLFVAKNGVLDTLVAAHAITTVASISGSTIIRLAVNDTLNIQFTHFSAGAISLTASIVNTWMAIRLLGVNSS